MPETQGNWGAAVRGVGVHFREFFSQNVAAYAPDWEPVVKNTTDDSAQASYSGKTGSGVLSLFQEGSTIPRKQRFKLYDTGFVHDQYGGQIEVTRKQLMNRDFSEAFNEFKDLATSGNVTRSKAPAQIFNGAFATTAMKNGIKLTFYGDAKPLCSTIHPRVDGGAAQSNASATGITLTESNLEVGRLALLQQLQDDGNPMTFAGAMYLVVPLALEKTAKIITGSDLRSGTTNNDINIYNGGAVTVMSSNWLGTAAGGLDTEWFLVVPSVARLLFVLRNGLSMDQSVDKNTKSTLFDVILDFSVGHSDWRGVWGSKGDGAAYSS